MLYITLTMWDCINIWYTENMEVKRKPAQTTAPVPPPGVLFILRYLQLLPAQGAKNAIIYL